MKIYNLSTQVTERQACLMVTACNKQMKQHFCPAWGFTPRPPLVFDPSKTLPAVGTEDFFALVNHDQVPNAAGYHTEYSNGQKVGFIMTEAVLDNGGTLKTGSQSVSACLSHEYNEFELNPRVDVWVEAPDGYEYPQEASDATQGDSYEIDGIAVSNFLWPAWFDMFAPVGARLDQMSLLKKPFTINDNGYSNRRKVGDLEVQQIGLRQAWKKNAVLLPRFT